MKLAAAPRTIHTTNQTRIPANANWKSIPPGSAVLISRFPSMRLNGHDARVAEVLEALGAAVAPERELALAA